MKSAKREELVKARNATEHRRNRKQCRRQPKSIRTGVENAKMQMVKSLAICVAAYKQLSLSFNIPAE